jgi:hypothetical protein
METGEVNYVYAHVHITDLQIVANKCEACYLSGNTTESGRLPSLGSRRRQEI